MAKAVKFTDLKAWQEGHKLVILVYKVSKDFPPEEKFKSTSQIRRAAVSVTSNIAEGFGRRTKADKLHFYTMCRGSLLELQNQLLIAKDIGILSDDKYNLVVDQSETTHKIINGLIRSINSAE